MNKQEGKRVLFFVIIILKIIENHYLVGTKFF